MQKSICLLLLLVCAGLAFAQKKSMPSFTSVYTDMKRDCRTLKEPAGIKERGDLAGVCQGFGGYRIFISHSAWSASYSIEKLKNLESITLGTDYSSYGAKGERVEWRVANGKPFAVVSSRTIYRLVEARKLHFQETPEGSLLVCLVALSAFEIFHPVKLTKEFK